MAALEKLLLEGGRARPPRQAKAGILALRAQNWKGMAFAMRKTAIKNAALAAEVPNFGATI